MLFYKSVLRVVPLVCRREGGEGPAVLTFLVRFVTGEGVENKYRWLITEGGVFQKHGFLFMQKSRKYRKKII